MCVLCLLKRLDFLWYGNQDKCSYFIYYFLFFGYIMGFSYFLFIKYQAHKNIFWLEVACSLLFIRFLLSSYSVRLIWFPFCCAVYSSLIRLLYNYLSPKLTRKLANFFFFFLFLYIFEMLVFVILQLCSKLQELSLYKLLHLLLLLLLSLLSLFYLTSCVNIYLFAYFNTTRRTNTLHPRLFLFRFRSLLLQYWFSIILHLHFGS